jgi:hypothetical protein
MFGASLLRLGLTILPLSLLLKRMKRRKNPVLPSIRSRGSAAHPPFHPRTQVSGPTPQSLAPSLPLLSTMLPPAPSLLSPQCRLPILDPISPLPPSRHRVHTGRSTTAASPHRSRDSVRPHPRSISRLRPLPPIDLTPHDIHPAPLPIVARPARSRPPPTPSPPCGSPLISRTLPPPARSRVP